MQLFTQANCPQCVEAKIALKKANASFTEKAISAEMHELKAACEKIGIDYTSIKSAPVLIAGDQLWTGADCVIAIEEEEYL